MQDQIISTILHSLNTASSALTLLESISQERDTSPQCQIHVVGYDFSDMQQEEAPQEAAPQESTVEVSLKGQLLEFLNDPRYKLRTMDSIEENFNVDFNTLKQLLSDQSLTIKHRNSDGALLVGLFSRQ